MSSTNAQIGSKILVILGDENKKEGQDALLVFFICLLRKLSFVGLLTISTVGRVACPRRALIGLSGKVFADSFQICMSLRGRRPWQSRSIGLHIMVAFGEFVPFPLRLPRRKRLAMTWFLFAGSYDFGLSFVDTARWGHAPTLQWK